MVITCLEIKARKLTRLRFGEVFWKLTWFFWKLLFFFFYYCCHVSTYSHRQAVITHKFDDIGYVISSQMVKSTKANNIINNDFILKHKIINVLLFINNMLVQANGKWRKLGKKGLNHLPTSKVKNVTNMQ